MPSVHTSMWQSSCAWVCEYNAGRFTYQTRVRLLQQYAHVLEASPNRPSVYHLDQNLFFHPNLA